MFRYFVKYKQTSKIFLMSLFLLSIVYMMQIKSVILLVVSYGNVKNYELYSFKRVTV